MIWTDAATWLDSMYWLDSDVSLDLGDIVETEVIVNKSPPSTTKEAVDYIGLIQSMVPLLITSYSPFTEDSTIADAIPEGYYLDKIIVIESTGHTGQISAGTTASGVELFYSAGIAGSDSTAIDISKAFSTTKSIYLHHAGPSDTWNSMSISIYLLMYRL